MKELFKPHLNQLNRYQTSLGRDIENGIRLDRNEKVSDFSNETMKDIWHQFPNYCLSASPESNNLYEKISLNLEIDRTKIFVTSGITEGIRVLYEFFAVPGDNVVCLDPTYPMYKIFAEMQQIEYRKFTYDETTLKPDLRTLEDNLDSKTKFVVIPNPNLPIESCFQKSELKELAQRCLENNTLLVIDEAYHYFGGSKLS